MQVKFKRFIKSLPFVENSWRRVRPQIQQLHIFTNTLRYAVKAPIESLRTDGVFGNFYQFQRNLAKFRVGWFCPKPFTYLYSHTDGTWKPCADSFTGGNTAWKIAIDTHKPFEYFYSNEMDILRKEMISGELKTAQSICAACIVRENANIPSPREIAIRGFDFKNHERVYNLYRSLKAFEVSGRYRTQGRTIDVLLRIFGNNCDLKCYMCYPYNSSSRTAELKKIDKQENTKWLQYLDPASDTNRPLLHSKILIDSTISEISKEIDSIHSIAINGGEPLIMSTHYEALDAILTTGHGSHINLGYATNLTQLSHKKRNFLDYAGKFKRIGLIVSVDGIGMKDEYIRYGKDWNKFIENLETVMKFDNIGIHINCTVSMLNVFDVEDIFDYFRSKYGLNVGCGIARGPELICVKHLPDELKRPLIEHYNKNPKKFRGVVETLREPRDDAQFQRFLRYMRTLDKARGTNFLNLWPQFESYASASPVSVNLAVAPGHVAAQCK